jgi:hypothetical protein
VSRPVRRALRCGLAASAASAFLLITLTLLPLSTSGCEAAGAIAYAAVGDVPVEPEYILSRVPTLIFVESYTNPDTTQDDADVLAHYVRDNLKKNLNNRKKEEKKKEIPMVFIDPQSLYDLRTLDSDKFHHMKIEDIGRRLGAKQVIYINMNSIGVTYAGGADIMKGVGSVRVKVVSCANGQTLWPQESSAGYPVSFESKLITPQQEITYDQARDSTMRTMALNVSRLFYSYNPADDDDMDTFSNQAQ